jgi:3-oxoacyl-[acyl-carrier protein] reductase
MSAGMFFASQAAAWMMRAHGGGKSSTSQPSGVIGHPRFAYATSKGAVIQMTDAGRGFAGNLVNAVAPGYIDSPLNAYRKCPALEAEVLIIADAPLGTGRGCRDGVRLLASDAAAFITGQTLFVDGGLDCRFPHPTPTSPQEGSVFSL